MSCINDDLVQRFIDGEVLPKEATLVQDHIAECEACATRIEMHRKLANRVKKTLDQLTEEDVGIPAFIPAPGKESRSYMTVRRLIYSVAAACILVVFFIIINNQGSEEVNDEFFMQIVEYEYDANRTLLEQQLVIEIIDTDGNVSELFSD